MKGDLMQIGRYQEDDLYVGTNVHITGRQVKRVTECNKDGRETTLTILWTFNAYNKLW